MATEPNLPESLAGYRSAEERGPGFTPGPWTVDASGGGVEFVVAAPDPEAPEDPWSVALVFGFCGYAGDTPANAHLIAAAPDLYEALERLIGFAESAEARTLVGDEGCLWPMEFARAALAKARGEQA